MAGALAKEPLFIESYKNGIDLHSRNAKVSFLIETPDDEFSKDLEKQGLRKGTKEFDIELLRKQCKYIKQNYPDRRASAKRVSFGVLYKMSGIGLFTLLSNDARDNGEQMQFTVDDCNDMIANFYKGYPALTKWQKEQIRIAHKLGYAGSPFGRRRYLPYINSTTDFRLKNKDERRAANTSVQGSGSDFMQCGIIAMHEHLDPSKYLLVCTVHDSVVAEVQADYVDEFIRIAKECLEHPKLGNKEVPLTKIMPFIAEAEIGPRYGELEEYTPPTSKK